MIILIMLTIVSIVIPAITLVEWVKYIQEEDAEFMASLRPCTTVPETASSIITVRTYHSEYTNRLETEADTRMRHANLFYERGICW